MKPNIKKTSNGLFGMFPRYELMEDYTFEFDHNGLTASFVIPAWFKYDGATGGSFLFWRKEMHTSPATLAHDWLYINLGDANIKAGGKDIKGDKQMADDIWLNAARREVNLQSWRVALASFAFKTIGWFLWKRREYML